MSALSLKKLGVLLFVSIAFNLFLGGLLVGSDMRHWVGGHSGFDRGHHSGHGGPGKMSHGGRRSLMGMHRVLGPEGQEVARDVMAGHREEMRPRFKAMRVAHPGVKDALLAEPFDGMALREAFTSLRTRGVEIQTAIHGAMTALAERLDSEDRRKIVARLPETCSSWHKCHRKRLARGRRRLT